MNKTCCPLYTIKCDAINFKLRKSQKNSIKSFNKFLYTNESNKKRKLSEKGSNQPFSPKSGDAKKTFQQVPKINSSFNISNLNDSKQVTIASKIKDYFANQLIDLIDNNGIKSLNELMNIEKKLKSKHKRLFRKLKKLKEKGLINDIKCKLLIILEF